MAQLRDAHTSALILEGTVEDVVAVADELGHDEVLFDGVGENFDPASVTGHAARAAELAELGADVSDRDVRASLKRQRDEHLERLNDVLADALPVARERLEEARERQERAES